MFEAKEVLGFLQPDGTWRYSRPLYALGDDTQEMRSLGYRLVKLGLALPSGYYARPWLLWAPLRSWERLGKLFWRGMSWLYWRGVLHKNTPPQLAFRWRDLRLGPDPQLKERKLRRSNPHA